MEFTDERYILTPLDMFLENCSSAALIGRSILAHDPTNANVDGFQFAVYKVVESGPGKQIYCDHPASKVWSSFSPKEVFGVLTERYKP